MSADPAPSREPTAPMTETPRTTNQNPPCPNCGSVWRNGAGLHCLHCGHQFDPFFDGPEIATPASPPPVAPIARETETREKYWIHRTAQPATATRTVTGDEWNAVQRLANVEQGEPLSPDQARFAKSCVEDLGEAEWRVRRDRDALAASSQRVGEAVHAAIAELENDPKTRTCYNVAAALRAALTPPSTHTPRG